MSVLNPIKSAQFITERSKHVFIKAKGIENLANYLYDDLLTKKLDIQRWKQHNLNPKIANKSAIDWIFLTDTLNFSFWSESDDKKYAVNFHGNFYTGYWSLCAAVNRALEEKIPICDPNYYCNLSLDKLKYIFRSDTSYEIPLLEERLRVLLETGKVLVDKFQGSFVNCITSCNNQSQKLSELIINYFPSYKDEAWYENQKVSFYKRAQILIADIWACFEGQGYGKFIDIETITMFADYRIPQVLVYFEVLEYSVGLLSKLKKNYLFQSGDEEEVEIRGCSIWAVKLICDILHQKLKEDNQTIMVNNITIDHYLWDYRQEHNDNISNIPFHKIRCIYY